MWTDIFTCTKKCRHFPLPLTLFSRKMWKVTSCKHLCVRLISFFFSILMCILYAVFSIEYSVCSMQYTLHIKHREERRRRRRKCAWVFSPFCYLNVNNILSLSLFPYSILQMYSGWGVRVDTCTIYTLYISLLYVCIFCS